MAREFSKFLKGEQPEQLVQGKQIYQVKVRYHQPLKNGATITGHMVISTLPEKALDIANKHHIGNPMGEIKNVTSRSVSTEEYSLKRCLNRKGDIWYEDKAGNLQGVKMNKEN